MFQRTGDTLCSAGRGRGGQTRFISEALLREEYEAVEAVAKKTVSRRKKVEPSEDIAAATVAPRARKPRTKKAAVKDEVPEGAVETVVKTRKKKSTKDKEVSEAAVVVDEAAAAGGQVAVVATKIKRVSKSKSKVSTLDTALKGTILPAPPVVKTQLRPYQQECVDQCLENLKNGIMRQIVSLPVGSGKTVSEI